MYPAPPTTAYFQRPPPSHFLSVSFGLSLFWLSSFFWFCVFVSIHTSTHFECVGGHHASVCVYTCMQYDTHTNWRTGEERADSAGVKSEGRLHIWQWCHMLSLTFRAHHGKIHSRRWWCDLILMPYLEDTWHSYEWVMAHVWMSHGTRINESWHTYEWVMAHIWSWCRIWIHTSDAVSEDSIWFWYIYMYIYI